MLDTQHELDEALSRPIANDTTDLTELEDELEELLKQPTPAVVPRPIPEENISTPVLPTVEKVQPVEPETDPFADLELRLQNLGVKERKFIQSFVLHRVFIVLLSSSKYKTSRNRVFKQLNLNKR